LHRITGCTDADDAIYNAASKQVQGYYEGAPDFTDKAASVKNGAFQSNVTPSETLQKISELEN
jgi:hypothetical protein